MARSRGFRDIEKKLALEAVEQLKMEWPGADLVETEDGVDVVLGDMRRSWKWAHIK